MLRQATAKIALSLPVDPEPARVFKTIMAGEDGCMYVADMWNLVPHIPGVREQPISKPHGGGFTYNAWIIFLKKGDNPVIAREVCPAEKLYAEEIRMIVGYGVTCDKHLGLAEDRLPTPNELAKQF